MDQTTALDLFKFYSNEMKEIQAIYAVMLLAFTIGLAGIILWFLTSDKPYKLIAKIKYARNAFWVCLLFLALVEGRIILYLMGAAGKIQTAISSVAPKIDAHLSISSYTYKKMSLEIVVWCYGLHFIMYALLAYLIWKSKRTLSLADADHSKRRTREKTSVQVAA